MMGPWTWARSRARRWVSSSRGCLLLAVFWLLRPSDVPVREVVRVIPDVLRLLRALVTDRAVPLDVRIVLVGLIAWILSPIDLIPEFIPGLGPLDDVIVAIVAMRYARRRIGIGGISARWTGSDDGLRLLVRVIGTLTRGTIEACRTRRERPPSGSTRTARPARVRDRVGRRPPTAYDAHRLRWLCPCAYCRGEAGHARLARHQPHADGGADAARRRRRWSATTRSRSDWGDGHHTGYHTFMLLREQCPCDACARERGHRHDALETRTAPAPAGDRHWHGGDR